ncbi:MAG TPA: protein kinase [Ktedonobacteraceae bacterium]|nr:protein kinase [Ktedonobacteraceae bacterium]
MALEGQSIGRYQLSYLLGSGGMGEVYLAIDVPVQRQVAIKVMRSEVSAYPNDTASNDAARLFQREVKAIASLDHPHILPLYDYGEDIVRGSKITYMVMPYRAEGTLVNWLHKRTNDALLSPLDIAQIIAQAASALQYAHDRQIIHQDVKPSNFLIRADDQNPDRPYLLLSDFGVAKLSSMTSNSSQSVRGTPTYMAPEQWEGNAVLATDQYALAIMAYELLTGRAPFLGGLTQMMYQHIHVQPQPPSVYNPHIPSEVNEVVLHALAKKPEDRFRTIFAFVQAFNQAVQAIDKPTLLKMQHNVQEPTIVNAAQSRPQSGDIFATLAISAEEAERGSNRTLNLPGGQRVSIVIPPGIRDGEILRLDNQGKTVSSADQIAPIVLTISVKPGEKPQAASPAHNYEATVSSTPPQNLRNSGTVPVAPIIASSASDSSDNLPTVASRRGAAYNIDSTVQAPYRGVSVPHQRRFPLVITLLLLVLLLVLVGGGIYFAKASFGFGASSTPTVGTTATVVSSPVTATSSVTTSVTPSVATGPTNTYTHSGVLALNDPLRDNSQGHAWLEGTNSLGATCQFTGGAYQSTQPNSGYFHACLAQATNYNNFVFEVQATLISGDYMGLIFRSVADNYYYFRVDPTGQYTFKVYQGANDKVLAQGPGPIINAGQTYLLAVVANYGNFTFYVDHQQIAQLTDPTFSSGHIGVFVGDQANSAVAVFRNAHVWTL